MKAILVNYNYRPEWLLTSGLDYYLYDRSEGDNWLDGFPKERILKTRNIGNIDYDKLSYLVDFYDNLPDVFLWGKSNLFKYVPEDIDFASYTDYAPLLKQNHKTYSDKYGAVCYYQDGMYYERNDSWYLQAHPARYYNRWSDWAADMHLPNPHYIPFPPGGNFIVTRERVHRYSRDYYEKMRSTLPYTMLPGEAQLCERSYNLLWS